MRTDAIRMTKSALLAVCVLAISACAHTPSAHPLKGPAVEPTGFIPPAEPSSTYPEAPTPPSAQATEPADPALNDTPTQVAGLTPAQYADLFDRMRAGFKLDDVERVAVEQQLNWFASHPDYLERAFGRALEISRGQGARSFELRAAVSRANLARGRKGRAALDELGSVYGSFTEGFRTLDLIEAKALLGRDR